MIEIRHKDNGGVLRRVDAASLQGVDLSGAALFSADLTGADLRGANLQSASLISASLRRAKLESANLMHATLYGADLWGATLRRADLRGTDLRSASLEKTNLSGARLEDARFDHGTRWPEGFKPAERGAVLAGGAAAAAPGALAAPRPRGDVLVVEDDPMASRVLAARLGKEGYHVAVADNGREALKYLRSHPLPRLILLDVMMPVMDGWAFRIEQQRDPRLAVIPVVICSAAYDPVPVAAMMKATGYLAKPYDLDLLIQTVALYCD